MEATYTLNNKLCIVHWQGEIAGTGAAALKQEWKPYLENREVRAVILDLTGVDFLDSQAIGVIVSAARTLSQRQARMALCAIPERLTPIVKMVNIGRAVEIYSDLDEALFGVTRPLTK